MEKIFSPKFLTLFDKMTPELLETIMHISIIAIAAVIIIKIALVFCDRVRQFIEKTSTTKDERLSLRAHTITGMISNLVMVFVGIIALMLIAGELGINLAPIIAGAGVLGLAISFGAQSLVKDVITGFFILLEDQYGIGDIIQVDSHVGIVEHMNLRTTILRDIEGNVHILPNGEIKQVVVMTKSWSRALIDIKVFYKQDLNRVFAIISEEADKLAAEWPDKIIEKPELLGIDSIDPNGVTIRIIMKTKPAQQWSVSREFKRRIIESFNAAGIDLPFFQSVGYVQS